MLNNNVAVVIPVLNEGETIQSVVQSVAHLDVTVIVVDDGSTDNSATKAAQAGAIVVKHECNRGYEFALGSGFDEAVNRAFEYVMTFDGDAQFDPMDIQRVIDRQHDTEADLIIGIRDYRNRRTESLLSYFGRFRFGVRDPLCGLKLYRVTRAIPFLPFDTVNLVGMQLAFRMLDGGCSVAEQPIHVEKRLGLSRYGASLKGELRIVRALFKAINIFGLFSKNVDTKS